MGTRKEVAGYVLKMGGPGWLPPLITESTQASSACPCPRDGSRGKRSAYPCPHDGSLDQSQSQIQMTVHSTDSNQSTIHSSRIPRSTVLRSTGYSNTVSRS